MRTRSLVLAGILAALLLAGVGSFYASGDPDGLERVAGQVGFLDTAERSVAADGPFADYATAGVDDERLSGGLAGVVGSLVVLLVAGALGYAVRRRGGPASGTEPDGVTSRSGDTDGGPR